MTLANYSSSKLSYPTQVVFRSSKVIPVMIGGVIFLKKRYSWTKISAAVLLTVGLIGVSLSDKKVKNQYDFKGILASIISLCLDAFCSNFQEKALKEYKAPQREVISMVYLTGALYLAIIALFLGEFEKGFNQCKENPKVVVPMLMFSLLGAVGVEFVYLLMSVFGSVTTVMVTSLRKGFTVIISYLLFQNKKFTVNHGVSMGLIVIAMVLNFLDKKDINPEKKVNENETNETIESNEDKEEEEDNAEDKAYFKYLSEDTEEEEENSKKKNAKNDNPDSAD
ncbi:Adenosine 3'-phospho 5'-phosphosulfate transporter 2 [Histomonas meleagridis]|uniref:Adenosine 3'-phospho 5'-phosphosulfate transporter 2 n=1 Tax=Histomonas meleagridis TaxID=135588 RepID=UPI00355A9051|nr:Adenosine 3'-phospho 5'-phosphosulfate transporter 2 [Histomonas meleagridis]KAH0804710.1 Adenosine 3'-phospho 5'-phosphosulfate transporter 2 [Histomonas meleagridis]